MRWEVGVGKVISLVLLCPQHLECLTHSRSVCAVRACSCRTGIPGPPPVTFALQTPGMELQLEVGTAYSTPPGSRTCGDAEVGLVGRDVVDAVVFAWQDDMPVL